MHVPLFPINKGMLVLIIIYLLVQIKVLYVGTQDPFHRYLLGSPFMCLGISLLLGLSTEQKEPDK